MVRVFTHHYQNIPITGLSNSHVGSPIATPLETTDYEVLVNDQFGCQNTDTVRVTVKDDFKIVASNVFAPDDNGQNDTWRGRPAGPPRRGHPGGAARR